MKNFPIFRFSGSGWASKFWLLILFSSLFFSEVSAQNVRKGNQISFQGKLEQGGKPVTGNFSMLFTLWETGWSETQSVNVRNGLYAATLGSVKGIPDSVFANRKELELEIRVNGQTLEPRVKIYPVPFAYKAQTVEPLAIEGKHIQNKTIEAKHLKDGIIGANSISEGSISSIHIKNGSIEAEDLKAAGFAGLMATDANGKTTWLDFSTVSRIIFASANLTNPLSQGRIFIGNENGLAREQSLSGDISLTGNGFVTVQNSAINSFKIADGAVQTVDLADNSVLNVKIQDGAVNSQKIQDHTIFPNDLAFSSADMVLATDTTGKPYWEFKTAFAASTGTAWNVTGNAGTDPLLNFIGTTDSQPLIFKVNNQFSGKISPTDGNMYLGYRSGVNTTGSFNYFSGYFAGTANTTGFANTFVGYWAGRSNIDGIRNTFVGSDAGKFNISGGNNTFVGFQAGVFNTGVGNTSIGNLSGRNSTGGENTFIGNLAGNNFQILSNSVIIGSQAGGTNGTTATGAGNIFLGYQAGGNELGSNKLYIANSNTSAPLIFGDFANNFASVNGSFALGFSTAGNGMLAFNTGSFYGYTGGQWNKFATVSSTLTGQNIVQGGNTFATAVVIGTNDNFPLLFKANNQVSMYLNTYGGLYLKSTNAPNSVYLGEGAGKNTSGIGLNTFIGHEAGFSNTTGVGNVFLGLQAGGANTNGIYNVSLGYQAGYNNNGDYNVVLGDAAHFLNTIGSNNVVIGHLAGYNNNNSGNIFLGNEAGRNETGSNKLYIANSNTSAPLIFGDFANNFASVNGSFALGFSTAGNGMLAFNTGSFYGYSGGAWNKFATVSSNFTTAILQGGNAFATAVVIGSNDNQNFVFETNNTEKARITSKGVLEVGQGTVNNVLIGKDAGLNTDFANTNVQNFPNTFIGLSAGRANTTGSSNYFSGFEAGFSNTTGGQNYIAGYRAGRTNTGSANHFSGFEAGYNNSSGLYNHFSGHSAGIANTTGNNNTAIGFQANLANNNLTNAMALGNGAIVDASNKIRLGNNAVTQTELAGQLRVNGNAMGINDYTFPTTRGDAGNTLQSNGLGFVTWSATFTSAILQGGNAFATAVVIGSNDAQPLVLETSGTEKMRITAAGNVGIGTNTPNAPLQFPNTGANRKIVLYDIFNNDHQFYGFGINSFALRYQTDGTSTDHVFYAATSSTTSNELMRIRGNGNVGIGTGIPTERLTVVGNTNISNNTFITGTLMLNNAANSYTFPTTRGDAGNTLQSNGLGFVTWSASSGGSSGGSWFITGNAGTNPATNFIGTTDNVDLVLRTNNTEKMRITATGSVGIGINNPTEKLHVLGGVGGSTIGIETTSGTDVAQLVLKSPSRTYTMGTNSAQDLYINEQVAGQNRLRLSSNGNLMIGSGTATEKLTVEGNANILGSLTINPSPNNYTFPTSRGDAGNTLQSNGLGFVTWSASAGGSNSGSWFTTGNAGTNPATNFIGTTDAQPLLFKVNGELAGRIDQLSTLNNTFFGYQAGRVTTGNLNVFNGYQAGFSNISGVQNTFLGALSGRLNTGGGYNTFLGLQAGHNNSGGSRNVFVGANTGYFNTGNDNTYVGTGAGELNAAGSSNVFIGKDAGYNETGSNKLYIANSNTPNPLIWGDFTGGSEKVKINGAFEVTGNVGLGTATPNTKFTINSTMSNFINLENSNVGTNRSDIKFTGTNANKMWVIGQDLNNNGGTEFFIWNNSVGNVMTMLASGDVAIGTAGAPTARFDLQGGNMELSDGRLYLRNNGDQNHGLAWDFAGGIDGPNLWGNLGGQLATSSNGSNTVLTWTSTSVGIGTTAPTEKLHVIGNILASGTITPSDKRFKTNITTLPNALNKVLAMNGVYYDWKIKEFPDHKFTTDRQIGFIAQELEILYPELVKTGSDGYKAVDYSKLTPILVEAIKEQQAQIEKLQAEKTATKTELEGKLQSQQTELDLLKKQMAQVLQLLAKPEGEKGKK